MDEYFNSHVHITQHSSKECQGSSRLPNLTNIDDGVKEASSSEYLPHQGNTTLGTGSSTSKQEDEEEEGDDVLKVVQMSPEMVGELAIGELAAALTR